MDFSLNQQQEALKRAAISFAEGELGRDVIHRDQEGSFSFKDWQKCAEYGVQGLAVPEEFGGSEADALSIVLTMEGLGFGCRDAGLLFALNTHMWSAELPISKFGNQVQRHRYLTKLCRGEYVGAHAITESEAGSDAFSLRTRVERQDDTYVLNGTKMFVSNGPIADLFVVYATHDRSQGAFGISAFIVERQTPGLFVGQSIEKMGLRTCPLGELALDECRIPVENRLGPEGVGASIFQSAMDWERTCVLAFQVGAMERQLEACVKYARERIQFGQPIGKFQSVSNRIADMKVRLESSRLLLYRTAWLLDQGKRATLEAAIAKLHISEAALETHLDAVRIHGGYGYMTELGIERDVRDAIAAPIYSGTSDIQRVIISRLLGL